MQRLDGGAMFGVVPKALWERRIPADERNRIPLALRCLLIEHDDGLVLIDTGIGNKENDKFRDIYGVDNAGRNGRTKLEDALADLGRRPEDIKWVINTHLHFDHAGGNTTPEGLAFPHAQYVVQRRELEFARHTNERTAGSYLGHNFERVPFKLIDGETEILPGMVHTDFAFNRWLGNEGRAEKFYQEFGVCLAPADVARAVVFAVQQPSHVVIAQLMVVPISQS